MSKKTKYVSEVYSDGMVITFSGKQTSSSTANGEKPLARIEYNDKKDLKDKVDEKIKDKKVRDDIIKNIR